MNQVPVNVPDNRLTDGDDRFLGVDQRTDPARVAPGYGCDATNKRFRDGKAEDRPSVRILPIGPDNYGKLPFDRPQGACVFQDPDGFQWFIIAAGGKVYRAGTHLTATEIPLPSGVVLDGEVEFTQAFNKLLLWRQGSAPLELEDLSLGFFAVTDATSESGNGTGTLTIPNATRGEFMQNRVLAVLDDSIYVSDALNYTRYSLTQQFRINDGSDDRLLAVRAFGTDAAIAFKTKSIHLLGNLNPDRNGDWSFATRERITNQHGLVGANAITQAGADLFYFSTAGLTSVRLTEENKVKAVEVPLSYPMKALWSRINWSAAWRAQLTYDDSYLYWAVPVDDSPVPNAIAIYDFVNKAWAGTDEGDTFAFGVLRWLPAFYNGERRLFWLDYQGLVRFYEPGTWLDEYQGDFLLAEDGSRLLSEFGLPLLSEDLTIQRRDFDSEFLSRGLSSGVDGRKRFLNGRLTMSTLNPSFSVDAVVEGVAEETALVTNQTRSRVQSNLFGVPDWDPTNVNDDAASAHRQDYSIVLPNGGMYCGSGVLLSRMQASEFPLRPPGKGRYVQIRFSKNQGNATLHSLTLTSALADRNAGYRS